MPALVNSKCALYCRLSKDDEQIGESTSIATQRLMLMRYCQEHNLTVVDFYIDDGYSGLSFERPAFMRMIDDIESGLIDRVITKDLSRLGRDYIMTGYLVDIYFSKMEVQYIAINDGIDTRHDNNDIAPFKNIMNDMYAKDISRKIKTAKRQRAYKGMYISAQTPYGYKVDPSNRNHLIPDTDVVDNVRLIYTKALAQKTLSTIAAELTDLKILTPAVYKAQHGESRFAAFLNKEPAKQCAWNPFTVENILHDPVYIGHMVNHKYETINYKTKERRRVPKEERIVVKNTHEAIIDPEDFNRVQEILRSRSRIHRHEFDNWLQDKVYCADCQRPMSLQIKVQKSGLHPSFRCIHSYKFPKECTGYRTYDYGKLLQLVYDKIASECPEPNNIPELNKTLIRQRTNRILIGKRKEDGSQDVQILLNDHRRRRKGDLPWLQYW